jgi:hypothetical protein
MTSSIAVYILPKQCIVLYILSSIYMGFFQLKFEIYGASQICLVFSSRPLDQAAI